MRDLLVVTPTRGRPESLKRLHEAMASTCRGDTMLLAGLDDDDTTYSGYSQVQGVPFQILSGLRGAVPCMNAMVMPLATEFRYAGMLGDDCVPRTEGWDLRVMQALEAEPFAFCNDLYPTRVPGSHATHIFTRTSIIRALGYLGPPCFGHLFVDNAWTQWGKECGIAYLHDVVIEHLHFSCHTAPGDQTYKDAVDRWDADEAAWAAYQAQGLAEDVAKIRAVL